MADEYIKREDAIRAFANEFEGILDLLESIPAADVRSVVRGRWVNGKCDNCGEHAPYWCLATTFHESNFCPNCGADMRELNDED